MPACAGKAFTPLCVREIPANGALVLGTQGLRDGNRPFGSHCTGGVFWVLPMGWATAVPRAELFLLLASTLGMRGEEEGRLLMDTGTATAKVPCRCPT